MSSSPTRRLLERRLQRGPVTPTELIYTLSLTSMNALSKLIKHVREGGLPIITEYAGVKVARYRLENSEAMPARANGRAGKFIGPGSDPEQHPFAHLIRTLAAERKIRLTDVSLGMGYERTRISGQLSLIKYGKWTWTWAFGRHLIEYLLAVYPDLIDEREYTAALARELDDPNLARLLHIPVPAISEALVMEPESVEPVVVHRTHFRPTKWD